MASQRKISKKGPDVFFAYLIPLVFCGLAVADFYNDGKIDKYLIGALMVFGLGALGYRIDTAFEKWADSRNRGSGSGASP